MLSVRELSRGSLFPYQGEASFSLKQPTLKLQMWKHWECWIIYLFILKMWSVHQDWGRVLLSLLSKLATGWSSDIVMVFGQGRAGVSKGLADWVRLASTRTDKSGCCPRTGIHSKDAILWCSLHQLSKTSGVLSPYTAGSSPDSPPLSLCLLPFRCKPPLSAQR